MFVKQYVTERVTRPKNSYVLLIENKAHHRPKEIKKGGKVLGRISSNRITRGGKFEDKILE
jgi:hypothetical protein